jgi:ferrous iron transport protein A
MRRGRGVLGRRRGRQDQGSVPEEVVQVLGQLGPMSVRAAGGPSLIRLGALKKGERATIEGFEAGHSLVSRLAALGFTPGAEVEMIQNFGQGPVIVGVRDTRIALGRGEAAKVLVRDARPPVIG